MPCLRNQQQTGTIVRKLKALPEGGVTLFGKGGWNLTCSLY